MKRMLPAIFLLLLALFSCTKNNLESNLKSNERASAQDNTSVYLAELERLGFTTFKTVQEFPLLPFKDLNGRQYTIADFKGKIVLFNIWATWCPPCRMEMPGIQKLHEAAASDDFIIIAVSTGEKKATVEYNYTFPIFLDEQTVIGSRLASRGIPTTYIIDKEGKILAATIGARSYDGSEFIKLMKNLAGN